MRKLLLYFASVLAMAIVLVVLQAGWQYLRTGKIWPNRLWQTMGHALDAALTNL